MVIALYSKVLYQVFRLLQVENECTKKFCKQIHRRGKRLEDNNNLTKEEQEYLNYRQLLKYEQAPPYLQHNPYIREGYRKLLPTKLCWER